MVRDSSATKSTRFEGGGAPEKEIIHIFKLAGATHRLKIGIVEDGCDKVALVTIHSIEFRAVCHDLLHHQAARTIRRLLRPPWRSPRIAIVK